MIYKKRSKPALNGLSLKFYANQITSLLGHNGAGKSTLMSILTGLQAPTSGDAYVFGYKLSSQLEQVQANMGFCPQYNILFDNLTVGEHIRFYAMLKGVPKDQIDEQVNELTELLAFAEKRNDRSKHLSGGQKRKLSVAIAFVGRTPVVLLDEPTAGVDPFSRRAIWDLLMQFKANRTIILTTHHMDEADILGDRIAIVSQGRLRCYGSSLFLKTTHGHGYHLIFERDLDDRAQLRLHALLQFVQQYIPEASVVSVTPTEVVLNLPSNRALDGSFSSLFKRLEEHEGDREGIPEEIKNMGLLTYGLSDTSLEEIFLDLADDPSALNQNDPDGKLVEEDDMDDSMSQSQVELIRKTSKLYQFTDDGKLPMPPTRLSLINRRAFFQQRERVMAEGDEITLSPEGPAPVSQQMRAMFVKRLHHFKRSKMSWLLEFLLPLLIILLGILFTNSLSRSFYNPPMPLHPWLMTPPTSEVPLSVFYENNLYADSEANLTTGYQAAIASVASRYGQSISSPYGWTGTRCIPREYYQFIPESSATCYEIGQAWLPGGRLTPSGRQEARNCAEVQCVCESGKLDCPVDAVNPDPPPNLRLQTTDLLYDLTAYNVSDYLVKTNKDFILRRFGGVSFKMSDNVTIRGFLEEFLNPRNPLFSLLGNMTRLPDQSTDPFWSSLADILRLSLPPTHYLQVWFNNKGYVSAPSYLNLLQNMQLRMLASGRANVDERNLGVAVVNYPIPLPPEILASLSDSRLIYDLTLALFAILGLSFIPASFVTFLVAENSSGSKHSQLVCGLHRSIYWLSAYLWDIINYLLSAILCVLVFVAFQKLAYVAHDAIGAFITVMLLYGLAVIPMMYIATFFIKVPSTALVVLVLFNLLLGSLTVMVTYILEVLATEDDTLVTASDVLKEAFLIFPQYAFGRALYDLAVREYALQFRGLGIVDDTRYENAFGWHVTGSKICALVIEAAIFFSLVVLVEYGFYLPQFRRSLRNHFPKTAQKLVDKLQHRMMRKLGPEEDLSADVKNEKQRVISWNAEGKLISKTAVATLELTKFFRRKKKPSVNRLSFAVRPAECFGLLGLNGAGKTTTFKMLTGLLRPTSGCAYLSGHHVQIEQKAAQRSLGFCPQFDTVLDSLTGRETLTLYARLRGYSEKVIPELVERVLRDMTLLPHADKRAKNYSGGNRRKLSTAIALLGEPKVILLDEPTSGMDPGAKRFMWYQVSKLLKKGKAVVLTSHSMEECEALCHRVGIMVNGQFKCLGTLQHLKNTFGNGYIVQIRLNLATSDRVHKTLPSRFGEVTMSNHQTQCPEFQFAADVKLSDLFDYFNQLRVQRHIDQFSVKQTTLDQVFVNFAREQFEQADESSDDELTEEEVM